MILGMATKHSHHARTQRILVRATVRLQKANERAQRQIEVEFASLLLLAETLKKHNSAFVAPWETKCVSTYRPSDQRVFQVRNAKDAVLKVLSKDPANAKLSVVSGLLALPMPKQPFVRRFQTSNT